MATKARVLITGATGFVGANLVRRFLKDGKQVHILTRKTSNRWRLKGILPQLQDHIVDLREESKLKKVVTRVRPQIVCHLATSGIYGGVHLAERELVEINLLGTINLLKACGEIDYRAFINTGSSSEYGPKLTLMRESGICEPVNMYGFTKLAATLYGQLIAKMKNRPIIGLRLFSPFGPYDDKSRLMTYAITYALQDKPLNLANPNAVRDYIYIEDVLSLYLLCIKKARELSGEIFNVGTGYQTKISYVINKIIKFSNSKSRVRWRTIAPRSFDTKRWEASMAKTCKALNWKPEYSVGKGIEKSIIWFSKNLNLYV